MPVDVGRNASVRKWRDIQPISGTKRDIAQESPKAHLTWDPQLCATTGHRWQPKNPLHSPPPTRRTDLLPPRQSDRFYTPVQFLFLKNTVSDKNTKTFTPPSVPLQPSWWGRLILPALFTMDHQTRPGLRRQRTPLYRIQTFLSEY